VGVTLAIVGIAVLSYWELNRPVNIIPWSPSEDSPYVCFAAIKGDSVKGISCMEKLSIIEVP